MTTHIQTEHSGYSMDSQTGASIPNDLICSMYITDEEECQIKIPANRIPYKIQQESAPNTTQGTKQKSRSGTAKNTVSKRTNLN